MLGLPRRRDAQIEGGAQRHGHAGNLLTSSRRPEQFVEQVAEPCFEYVDFGIRDRHARGPVVHDAPSLNIMFDRAAKARPGAGHDIEVGRQFAECGAVAQRGAMPGHCARIAQTPARAERPISTPRHRAARVAKGAVPLTLNHDRLRATRRGGGRRSRPQPRSGGAARASLDGLATVRPPRRQAVMAQLALRETVRGRSSSTRSCVTFGVIRPRSPRSRRTRP